MKLLPKCQRSIILSTGKHQLSSQKGVPQGDLLEPVKFCEALHTLFTNLHSAIKTDDLTAIPDKYKEHNIKGDGSKTTKIIKR